MKQKVIAFFTVALLIIIVFGYGLKCSYSRFKGQLQDTRYVRVPGICDGHSKFTSGEVSNVYFKYKDRLYSVHASNSWGDEDKFLVLVDTQDIDKSIVDESSPVIEPFEIVDSTVATIVANSYPGFEYFVNGVKFSRWQMVPP